MEMSGTYKVIKLDMQISLEPFGVAGSKLVESFLLSNRGLWQEPLDYSIRSYEQHLRYNKSSAQ
jgi:hypothetical protein